MSDECPQCGSRDFETRRESNGRTYSYESRCRACDHFWWQPGDVTLGQALSHADDPEISVEWIDGSISALVSGRDFSTYVAKRGRYHRGRAAEPARTTYEGAIEFAASVGASLPTLAELRRISEVEDCDREWTMDGPTRPDSPDPDDDIAAFRLARRPLRSTFPDDDVGHRLRDAIYAAPDSDDPRWVYADHLQRQGDPRGELIALQLVRAKSNGAITDRERELWERHRFDWLGELAAIACPMTLRFERGFLRSCRILDSPRVRDVIGEPPCQAIEELDCEDPKVLADPRFCSLRRVAASAYTLAAITSPELAIEAFVPHIRTSAGREIRRGIDFDSDQQSWQAIATSTAFVNVRSIAIETRYAPDAHVIRKLLASPLGQRLTSIDIYCNDDRYALAAWVPILRTTSVQRVTLNANVGWDPASLDMRLTVERLGAELVARCSFDPAGDHAPPESAATQLDALTAAGVAVRP